MTKNYTRETNSQYCISIPTNGPLSEEPTTRIRFYSFIEAENFLLTFHHTGKSKIYLENQ